MTTSPAPPRSSRLGAILVVLAVGGSAVGVMIYQSLQGKEKPLADVSGFDLSETDEAPQARTEAAPGREPSSSLGMVKPGMPGAQFGPRVAQKPAQKAAASFTDLARGGEAKVHALFQSYLKKYPIISQYSREWMSYPDLKKLNDDYGRDHDPIKFMEGVARSKNFGTMVKKYAGQPAIQSFVKQSMQSAPSGLLSAGMEYLESDKNLKALVDNVGQALGLPPGMLGGSGKVDEKSVMDSVMKSNPELQKALPAGSR